jgi:hypothetical protein
MKKQKAYWAMNAEELAAATKEFDDPRYDPPAVKPTAAQRAQWRRWQRGRAAARARLTLSLEKPLIAQTDEYAARHGVSFSEVVADALRRLMRRKSA